MANVKKELVAYGIGTVALQAATFLLIPLYASQFEPEQFGVLTFCLMFGTALSWFLGLQIFSGLFRYYYEAEQVNQFRLVKNTFAFAFYFNALLLTMVLGLAALIPVVRTRFFELVLWVTLSTIMMGIAEEAFSIYRLKRNPVKYILFNMSQLILQMLLIILFVLKFKMGIISVFYGRFWAALLAFVVFAIVGNYRYFSLRIDKESIKKMLRFSVPLIPGAIAMWVLNSTDNLFIEYYHKTADVGIYAFSYKIAMLIQVLLIAPMKKAWNPYIFSHIKNLALIKKRINESLVLYFAIGLACVLGMSLFSRDILSLFAKDAYLEGIRIIYVVSISYLLFGACALMAIGYHVAEKTRKLPQYMAIAAVVNIVLNFFVVPHFGYAGAACTTLASFIVLFLLYSINVKRFFPIELDWIRIMALNGIVFLLYGLSWLFHPSLISRIGIFMLYAGLGWYITRKILIAYLPFLIRKNKMSTIKHKLNVFFKRIANLIIIENVYILRRNMLIVPLSCMDDRLEVRAIDNPSEIEMGAFKKFASCRSDKYFEMHMLPRLKHPHWVALCTFDKKSGDLAYVAWVVKRNTEFIDSMKIMMNDGQFFLKDGYCTPPYRHHGIHQRMMQERINYCVRNRTHECFIGILGANKKGTKNVLEFGFNLYQVNYLFNGRGKKVLFSKRIKTK